MGQSDMERKCLGFFCITFWMDLWFLNELRYIRSCEPVPNAYWPKHFGLNIYCPFENVYLHRIQTYDLLHWNTPLGHCCIRLPPRTNTHTHTHTSCKQQPKTFSALYCRSIRASRMVNQHSLSSDTEKWYLCNNTIKFVLINKHCFPQIFD